MAAKEFNGTTTISYPTANSNEFRVQVPQDVGQQKNVLCVSLGLPLEMEGVENVLISERRSSNISRNPAQGDEDTADYFTAGAATARKGINGKTKQGDDVVSEVINFPNLSKHMCIQP
jgi:hypothetical protein